MTYLTSDERYAAAAESAARGERPMTASQSPADNELREAVIQVLHRNGCDDDCAGNCVTDADAALAVVAAHASQQQAAAEARGARSVIGDMLASGYIDQETADVFLPALAGES